MLRKYKEIVYGIFFGFGAAIMDTMIDARSEKLITGESIRQEWLAA